MFELLAVGTVDLLCMMFKSAGIPYGFGGVACVGAGALPADSILKEHYRLGSSMVILSRSFCKANHDTDLSRIRESFEIGVSCIRILEKEIALHSIYFEENREAVVRKVAAITDQIELGTISRINE